MCYSSAAGSTKEGQKAISRGVLILLTPPIGFMTIGAGLAVRYGKKRDDAYGNTDDPEEMKATLACTPASHYIPK